MRQKRRVSAKKRNSIAKVRNWPPHAPGQKSHEIRYRKTPCFREDAQLG
jgi:hypothetical protein